MVQSKGDAEDGYGDEFFGLHGYGEGPGRNGGGGDHGDVECEDGFVVVKLLVWD